MSTWGNPKAQPEARVSTETPFPRFSIRASNLPKLLLHVSGWIFCVCVTILVLSVVTGWSRPLPILVLQGMFPIVALPIWLVAIVAGFTKRWSLAAFAGFLCAVYAVLVLPALSSDSPAIRIDDEYKFSLFVANVSYRNPTPNAITSAVVSSQADVVVLNEVSDEQYGLLSDSGLLERYTTIQRSTDDPRFSDVIMTRLPVTDSGIDEVGAQSLPFVQVVLGNPQQPGGPETVKVMAVHVTSPSSRSDVGAWKDDLEDLQSLADSDEPLVLAGDFNSSLWHQPLRSLLSTGFSDAHDYLGDGLSRSWGPTWTRAAPFGAIMRLDHALTSSGVYPVEIGNREVRGSDHVAFKVELVVDDSVARFG